MSDANLDNIDLNNFTRPMVVAVRVSKVYIPDIVALKDVSLTVNKGEMVFLTGMSGAGKTTMLKLICAIEKPTKGLIEVAEQDLTKISQTGLQQLRQKIGVAYQDFKLLPKLTVFENIAMPMEIIYQNSVTIHNRVDELLEILGIPDKKNIPIGKLSRGEQQRVAIARAAANAPPLLLADEPTGNLDADSTERVMDLFHHLHGAGTTLIIATHDESIIQRDLHRILDLKQGELILNSDPRDNLANYRQGI